MKFLGKILIIFFTASLAQADNLQQTVERANVDIRALAERLAEVATQEVKQPTLPDLIQQKEKLETKQGELRVQMLELATQPQNIANTILISATQASLEGIKAALKTINDQINTLQAK